MLTKDNVEGMDEAALRKEVLIPLLTAMGFKDAYEYHGGAGEQGKDIVCWKPDELNTRQNLAIVAKATQMTGKAQANKGTAAEIQMQIRQCFGEAYTDPVSAEQQNVHRVWVVSNRRISKEAINAITSGVADPTRMHNVRFIDGDQLWELVEKHLPSSMWHFVKEVQKRANSIDSHYEPQITISGNQTTITLKEKFPGAAKEKPVKITTRFVDQEAARQFHTSLSRLQETGEPADIPASLIAGVDFPETMQAIFGAATHQQYSMRLLPIPNMNWVPTKLSLINEDGDNYICNFVRLNLANSGSMQATIISEDDNLPFSLTITFRFAERTSDFVFRPRLTRHDAVGMLDFLKLCRCLSKKPAFKMEDLRNGITFGSGIMSGDDLEPAGDGYITLIGMVADIQKKSGIQIVVPERDLTDEDIEAIQEVHEIVSEGQVAGTWDEGKATFQPDLATLESFVTHFADGRSVHLMLDAEETATLFGVQIPLGRVRQTLNSVRCANYDEVVRRYDELRSGTASITLHLVAGEDDTAVKVYLNWSKEPLAYPNSEAK